MKHIKTYKNIFEKYKKLPPEVDKFGKFLTIFVNKNINDNYNVFFNITKINDKYNPIASIFINTNDIFIPFRYISLYYNETTELMMISFITDGFINITEYLTNIFNNKKYKQTLKNNNEKGYFIEKNKINDLIKDINQKDYDLFLSTKKYNL